ncbi:hypothetical protein KIPB_001023 [Kipferlia bialata]|uniref:Uncharacterized protein n=1 Tax=Kipferlia bialata TaxID=797122 RepID=A0A9K3CN50_9EUKA|nr:hypothetical protein KIPB_001023 [Kipferlia bialata]|eukprot:g1023.t1
MAHQAPPSPTTAAVDNAVMWFSATHTPPSHGSNGDSKSSAIFRVMDVAMDATVSTLLMPYFSSEPLPQEGGDESPRSRAPSALSDALEAICPRPQPDDTPVPSPRASKAVASHQQMRDMRRIMNTIDAARKVVEAHPVSVDLSGFPAPGAADAAAVSPTPSPRGSPRSAAARGVGEARTPVRPKDMTLTGMEGETSSDAERAVTGLFSPPSKEVDSARESPAVREGRRQKGKQGGKQREFGEDTEYYFPMRTHSHYKDYAGLGLPDIALRCEFPEALEEFLQKCNLPIGDSKWIQDNVRYHPSCVTVDFERIPRRHMFKTALKVQNSIREWRRRVQAETGHAPSRSDRLLVRSQILAYHLLRLTVRTHAAVQIQRWWRRRLLVGTLTKYAADLYKTQEELEAEREAEERAKEERELEKARAKSGGLIVVDSPSSAVKDLSLSTTALPLTVSRPVTPHEPIMSNPPVPMYSLISRKCRYEEEVGQEEIELIIRAVADMSVWRKRNGELAHCPDTASAIEIERADLKSVLRKFDIDFASCFGRAPNRDDKGILKPLYSRWAP